MTVLLASMSVCHLAHIGSLNAQELESWTVVSHHGDAGK